MFLIAALALVLIAMGLVRGVSLARRAAIVVSVAGIAAMVPAVSAAAVMVQPRALVLGGLGIIVRVILAWSLIRAGEVVRL